MTVLYIHGKDGSATESEHYKSLFPNCDVIGLDYQTFTPWETGQEIRTAIEELKSKYKNVILIANSIGVYFSMNAGVDRMIQKEILLRKYQKIFLLFLKILFLNIKTLMLSRWNKWVFFY